MEVESLRTGSDGVEQFVWLRRREDEYHVLRRFLQHLEQGVACGSRQHVRLVEDVHPSRPRGCGHRRCVDADFSDVLDLVVRGSVEFDHIERCSVGDRNARMTGVVGLPVIRTVGAVQGFGKQTCRRGLAGTARSCEEVGVGDLVLDDLTRKGRCHVILTDDFVEPLRSILAIESLIVHWHGQ